MSRPDNRRRHPRFDVDGVYGRMRSDPNAAVLNLSADGLAIETGSWLEVGRSYGVKVYSGEDAMEIDGRVVWCRLIAFRDGHPRYQAGLHFGNALSQSGHRVVHFAEGAGAAGARRLFGRWEMPDRSSTAELRGDSRFQVRRLSRSGMLIHTESPPGLGSRLVFELDFGDADGEFHAAALVRNVIESESGSAGGFLIGVQFVELDRQQVQRLEAFLERCASQGARSGDGKGTSGGAPSASAS
ncbi:MAG TPA: PilZ domain-containing protein [Thermoanaerobaculia bacterium]|nr:PilZ domain-containing protein [Thermoanaerobaculia bacterium]